MILNQTSDIGRCLYYKAIAAKFQWENGTGKMVLGVHLYPLRGWDGWLPRRSPMKRGDR
jgi:hypothetical protein